MPIPIRPIPLSLALAAALPAGDLDAYFSNQSAAGPVTLVLDEADAERGDVFFSLFDRVPGTVQAPAPVLLHCDQRRRDLAPGQTAVLHLLAAPAAGSQASRRFRVVQAGQAGGFGFTFRVALRHGFPYAELHPDPDAGQRAELTLADPDLLVFWQFRAPAAGAPAS